MRLRAGHAGCWVLLCTLLLSGARRASADDPPFQEDEARAAIARAQDAFERGELPAARDMLLAVARSARLAKRDDIEGATLGSLLPILEGLFDRLGILEVAQRQAELAAQGPAPLVALRTRVNLASAMIDTGDMRGGMTLLDAAIGALRDAGSQGLVELSGALATRSIALGRIGNIAAALDAAAEARQTWGAAGKPDFLSYVPSLEASLLIDVGAFSRAAAVLKRASARENRPGVDRVIDLINLGICAYEVGAFTAGRSELTEAESLATGAGDREMAALARIHTGELELRARRPEEARKAYDAVLAREGLDDSTLGYAHAGLGEALRRLGHLREAHEEAVAALDAADRTGDQSLRLDALVLRSKAADGEDAPVRALEDARRAEQTLADLTDGLGFEQATLTRGRWQRVGEALVAAAIAVRSPEEIFRALESSRSNALLEAIGSERARGASAPADDPDGAAIANAQRDVVLKDGIVQRARSTGRLDEIRPAATELRSARESLHRALERAERKQIKNVRVPGYVRASLGETQASLRAGEVVVFFSLLSPRPGALVLTRREAAWRDLSKTAGEIEELILQLRGQMVTRADASATIATLREAAWLPLQVPPDATRIIICPDGALAFLPYDLLGTSEQAESAGRVQTVLVPSLTVREILLARGKREGSRVLAVGDPLYETGNGGGSVSGRFDRLPKSAEEVDGLTRPGDERLLRERATKIDLRAVGSAAPRWSAIHFACHGFVDDEAPGLSGLAITPTSEDAGLLTASEILRLPLKADVVTLSACETGLGRAVAGEGMIGLTSAFLAGCAPRVVASLWRVDDAATARFMEAFYAAWRSGQGAARCLEAGRRAVRDAPDVDWSHPYYWAGWVAWGVSD